MAGVGRLERDWAGDRWFVRYADPGQRDVHGGRLELLSAGPMGGFREGQTVRAEGELIDPPPLQTQAAYRVGDSSTNIITPLMPYFPLVVVFCQRYVRQAGIGTLASMMLPYSLAFLVAWTLYLLAYWGLGIPLGLQSAYTHP